MRQAYVALVAPNENCPRNPVRVQLLGESYDFPVPPVVADYLASVLLPAGVVTRMDDHGSPAGIRALRREHYAQFNAEEPLGTTALREIPDAHSSTAGAMVHQLIVNAAIVASFLLECQLFRVDLPRAVAEWLDEFAICLIEGGGIELVRVLSYGDTESRKKISAELGQPLIEKTGIQTPAHHRRHFREWLRTS